MPEDWTVQVKQAEMCREKLRERGVEDSTRQWLARLVSTRRIVIGPVVNALGYFRKEREEDGKDVKYDFPYDYEKGEECMETVAARTVNEIFRDHMFQLAITFHSSESSAAGGVSYQWGAHTFRGASSPDDEALKQLASGYARYGGALLEQGFAEYATGPTNELFGPARGDMEDWAYAGSWDKDHVTPCHPDTYGGYNANKTVYNDATLRTLTASVTLPHDADATLAQLGTDRDFLSPGTVASGHIPRNVRLSLLMADVVQPYVSVRYVNDLQLEDDIVPLRDNADRLCRRTRAVSVPKDFGTLKIEWTVGGGFNVDSSGVLLAKWDDLPPSFDGSSPPSEDAYHYLTSAIAGVASGVHFFKPPPFKNGRTRWHESESYPLSKNEDPYGGPMYISSIPLDYYAPGDEIAVYAYATLDHYWSTQPGNIKPDVPPQSHFVNARTNASWNYDYSNHTVKGQLYYFSVPVTIIVGNEKSELKEISERLPVKGIMDSFEEEIIEGVENHATIILFVGLAIGLSLVFIVMYGVGWNGEIRYGNVGMERGIEIGGSHISAYTID